MKNWQKFRRIIYWIKINFRKYVASIERYSVPC